MLCEALFGYGLTITLREGFKEKFGVFHIFQNLPILV